EELVFFAAPHAPTNCEVELLEALAKFVAISFVVVLRTVASWCVVVVVLTQSCPVDRSRARAVAVVLMTTSCASVVPRKLVEGEEPNVPVSPQFVEGMLIVPHVGGDPLPADFRYCPLDPALLFGLRHTENLRLPTTSIASAGLVVLIPVRIEGEVGG